MCTSTLHFSHGIALNHELQHTYRTGSSDFPWSFKYTTTPTQISQQQAF